MPGPPPGTSRIPGRLPAEEACVRAWPGCGDDRTDADHAAVFACIAGLRPAMRHGGAAACRQVLADLALFLRKRLAEQEALMERRGIPGLEEHRADHGLGLRICAALDGPRTGVAAMLRDLARLEAWLSAHIDGHDRLLAGHLRGGGGTA